MHLDTERIVFGGAALAVAMVLLGLGNVFETNTLWLICLSAFLAGVVIRKYGMKTGAVYFVASIFIGFFVSAQKMYVLTFGMIELYILLRELFFEKCFLNKERSRVLYYIGKLVIFNVIFLPVVIAAPQLVFAGEITDRIRVTLVLAFELAFVLGDAAYDFFQTKIYPMLDKLIKK